MCSDYRSVDFPKFDICKDRTDRQYAIVIADQVLELVQRPLAAAGNIHAMTRPGGWAIVATSFLFRGACKAATAGPRRPEAGDGPRRLP